MKLSIDNTHGTGFFVAAGLILTCHHVVKNAGDRPIKVKWQNQEDFALATVLKSFPDPDVDLSLLQFEAVENLPCVELDGAIAAFDDLYAYGYPERDPNGAGVVLRSDGLNGDVPPKIKFSDGTARPGLSGAPLLNPATGKVCGVVKYTEDRSFPVGGGGIPIKTVFECFPHLANLNRQFHQPQWGDVNPYKGLAYFEDDDARFFFGRTALTDSLLAHLEQNNFLALLGASGSGKSSVLRAGLLNQLRLGRLSGSDRWELQVMLPTERPLSSLANTFVSPELKHEDRVTRLETIENLIAKKSDNKEGLRQWVQTSAAPRVILVIDQFEECFTLCQDLQDREHFFALLLKALELPKDKFCLAIAMRADFFGKCVEREYGGLSKRIADHLVPVTPMNDDELREAIDEPAKLIGCEVESILREEIVRDVAGAPANLPLMQFALSELWQLREVNRLTLQAYKQKLGGIAGALEKRANAVYAQFTEELDKRAVKHIFLSLTQLGEGTEDTRRRVVMSHLVATGIFPLEVIEKVVKKLADEKLVVTSALIEKDGQPQKDAIVDVAHEALIRNWKLLRSWLDEDREVKAKQDKLEKRAEDWQQSGQSKAYLLPKQLLKDAKALVQSQKKNGNLTMKNFVLDFVKASEKRQNSDRLKRTGIFLVFPFIGSLVTLHFYILDRATTILSVNDCQQRPEVRFFLEYKLLFGYREQLADVKLCTKTLSNINLKGANLWKANFKNATLDNSNFQESVLQEADFTDANLKNADFKGSWLKNARFDNAYLYRSKFKNSNDLSENQLEKSRLCRTELPDRFSLDPNRDCKK